MSVKQKTKKFLGGSIIIILLLFGVWVAIAAQVTGAIFTTLYDGSAVNHNIYEAKSDVYLNGGPQPTAPCDAAGLPDGDYYFQVTDPSGKVLLSTDNISERKIYVSGGVIIGYLGTTHALGAGKCPGSMTVQLYPFNDTPNPGGEYKVWVTPVDEYSPAKGAHGFIPSKSKTDNFKAPGDANADNDNDGLTNGQEIALGTNPNNPDTDNDGLTDGQETDLGTNPLKPDTDGDGILDGNDACPTVNDPTNTCGFGS